VSLEDGTVSRVVLDPDQVLPDLYRDNNTWTPDAPPPSSTP